MPSFSKVIGSPSILQPETKKRLEYLGVAIGIIAAVVGVALVVHSLHASKQSNPYQSAQRHTAWPGGHGMDSQKNVMQQLANHNPHYHFLGYRDGKFLDYAYSPSGNINWSIYDKFIAHGSSALKGLWMKEAFSPMATSLIACGAGLSIASGILLAAQRFKRVAPGKLKKAVNPHEQL